MRSRREAGRQIVEEQEFKLSPDDFYVVMQAHMNSANPPTHMSCDDLRDPMAFGLLLFPVRTYERLQELNHARNPGSGNQ